MDSRRIGDAVERATPGDVITLAMDLGPVPSQVGAILRFASIPGSDPVALGRLVSERAAAIPRLRQRLVRSPFGCGPPVWVDDPDADPARHVRLTSCPAPGGERALLDLAAAVMTTPLRSGRPLWSAVVVTGLADGGSALLVVLNHVVADGVGGLAVLAALADGAPDSGPLPPTRPAPTRRRLAGDATTRRLQAVPRLPQAVRSLRRWLRAAGGSRPHPAAACTLIGPVGPRRRYEVVRAEIGPLQRFAHRHGATVNDAVLLTITTALGDLLATRNETVDPIALGIPVSTRRSTTPQRLGNQVAPILVPAPVAGDLPYRLEQIADAVRTGRTAATRPPPAGVATIMWWASRLGLLRRYMTHQRRMHTMVSSLHGPDHVIALGGSPVVSIVALASAETGNVRVSFDVLSYAGTLTITAVADPDTVPDLSDLAAALRAELAALADRPPADAAGPDRRALGQGPKTLLPTGQSRDAERDGSHPPRRK
jgi:WS/DGAT/MGAT family acyltransferase